MNPGFTWNIINDVRWMWSLPSMVNGFRAGFAVALLAGVIGWFMVLRRQSFAGHSIAVTGFPGAAAAVYLGLSATLGYFGFCVGSALVIALLSRGGGTGVGERAHSSALIAVVQAFSLALGAVFLDLYGGFLSSTSAFLFGNFLGITNGDVLTLVIVSVAVLTIMLVIGRRLLFASIDPAVAVARGVSVRALNILFLVLLGATVAEVSKFTGSLLVFALLVMPAATAQVLTARPGLSLLLTVVLGVLVTWFGLAWAYFGNQATGFTITSLAFACYVVAYAAKSARRVVRTAVA
ncbi:metal ABC transporter permease [Actinospica sp.]|uniref:metal ABC transporter permease n=1 Tax=Actinospica sp. TaxID=1872142 RepID=UPI002C8E362D|nr:metal ABC transporter permease [Actinospica sp.]HWG22740.1 metal ABC transporter permease [Actinospica sp.]